MYVCMSSLVRILKVRAPSPGNSLFFAQEQAPAEAPEEESAAVEAAWAAGGEAGVGFIGLKSSRCRKGVPEMV